MSVALAGKTHFSMAQRHWLLLATAALLIAVGFWEPLARLLRNWLTRPEYSHGLVIPVASAYLIWQRRFALRNVPFTGSWLGFLIAAAGIALWFAGELSTIFAVTQFALVVVIFGIAMALTGLRGFRYLWVPILLLLLAIPLPRFIYNNFSSELQLLSSQLGVLMLRLMDVSVFLEGNVIDLGHFQMQVVEACDGLRYLFPMMTLGLIVAYFFRGRWWQRVAVFLAAIPITIIMNSARIAMIGWFAERGNTALAQGLLHDVQGWVMFMLSSALLLGIVWLFWRARKTRAPWHEAFDFAVANEATPSAATQERKTPLAFIGAVTLLALAAGVAYALPNRAEAIPEREFCVLFPMQFGDYSGRRNALEADIYDALKVDDYLLANYVAAGQKPVNVFLAYYDSQRKGESVHSPRSCLPGGGWQIEEIGRYRLPGATEKRHVNRAVIAMGNSQQLVYYWFKQRDRWVTSEIGVKWYILKDALLRNRSDGAMVRLVTPLSQGESVADADRRLSDFAQRVNQQLPRFVPD